MVVKFGLAAAAATLALTLTLTGGIAQAAAYKSWEGEWTLNVEQSKYPASMPVIKNHVMQTTQDDGKKLAYTDNFQMGDGPVTHVTFDGAYDGKPYKMTNGQDMTVVRTEHGYLDHWSAPNGTTGKDDCAFDVGVKVMTCHGEFTPPGAKEPVTFLEVWNKTK